MVYIVLILAIVALAFVWYEYSGSSDTPPGTDSGPHAELHPDVDPPHPAVDTGSTLTPVHDSPAPSALHDIAHPAVQPPPKYVYRSHAQWPSDTIDDPEMTGYQTLPGVKSATVSGFTDMSLAQEACNDHPACKGVWYTTTSNSHDPHYTRSRDGRTIYQLVRSFWPNTGADGNAFLEKQLTTS
jgi:hypothetical protein